MRQTLMATIKELRERHGWTLAMVEAKTDHLVSASTILRIERGDVEPFRATKVALASAFSVDVNEIEWPVKRDKGDPA